MRQEPKFKLGQEVVCAGRPAWIVGIQYGPRRYEKHSPYDTPIRYELVRDPKMLKAEYIVDEKLCYELKTKQLVELVS